MRPRHPIRDLLLFWVGEKLWRRHRAKEERRHASQPFPQTKNRMRW